MTRASLIYLLGLSVALNATLISVWPRHSAVPAFAPVATATSHVEYRIADSRKAEAAALLTDLMRAGLKADDDTVEHLYQLTWTQVLHVYGEPVTVRD